MSMPKIPIAAFNNFPLNLKNQDRTRLIDTCWAITLAIFTSPLDSVLSTYVDYIGLTFVATAFIKD